MLTLNSTSLQQHDVVQQGPFILRTTSPIAFFTSKLGLIRLHVCCTVPISCAAGAKTSIFWRQQGRQKSWIKDFVDVNTWFIHHVFTSHVFTWCLPYSRLKPMEKRFGPCLNMIYPCTLSILCFYICLPWYLGIIRAIMFKIHNNKALFILFKGKGFMYRFTFSL